MLPPNSKDVVTATRMVEKALLHQVNVGLAQKLYQKIQQLFASSSSTQVTIIQFFVLNKAV